MKRRWSIQILTVVDFNLLEVSDTGFELNEALLLREEAITHEMNNRNSTNTRLHLQQTYFTVFETTSTFLT